MVWSPQGKDLSTLKINQKKSKINQFSVIAKKNLQKQLNVSEYVIYTNFLDNVKRSVEETATHIKLDKESLQISSKRLVLVTLFLAFETSQGI